MTEINLRKLTGIKVGDNPKTASADFKTHVNGLGAGQKIVFAGQDYKGTFTADANFATPLHAKLHRGKLELYLERPENHFTIKDVKIDTSGTHTFTGTGKNGEATIVLAASTPTITEKDSGWFTTELTGTPQTLKFGEWSNYDLPNQSYVDISFA